MGKLLYTEKNILETDMNIQDRYLAYAEAFELTYVDNDWSRLKQYFTEQASYDSGDGEVAHGRDAVLAKLEGAVNGLDRLMDSRAVEFTPASADGDKVSTRWTAHYTKAGLPDLRFGGSEYAVFDGDRISRLWDEMDPGAVETLVAWMTDHGSELDSG